MRFYIVVPNLNYGQFLRECLQSIEDQEGVELSVYLIDGGSEDESIDIAQEFCQRNGWTLEIRPGLGQAESIRFALEQVADVEDPLIVCWLNSDDVFLRSDALRIVADHFEKMKRADIVSLGGYFVDKDGIFDAPVHYDYHPLIRGNVFLRGGAFLQPATFWRNTVNRSVRINTELKYTFDGDYFLRMRQKRFSFYVNPRIHIAGYRLHGENLSLNIPAKRVSELAILYKDVLNRPLSAAYLVALGRILSVVGKAPMIGGVSKSILRTINNGVSYLTRYTVPSI